MSRFPRAGTPNAKSDLKMVTFRLSDKGDFIDIQTLELPQPLGIMFPSAEYLTRAGWTPQGDKYSFCIEINCAKSAIRIFFPRAPVFGSS